MQNNLIELEDLLSNISTYITKVEDINLIKKAYNLASIKHAGQFRISGEAYIYHPLEVAYILSNISADVNTICSALLHDVVEDCDVTLEYLKTEFNEEVMNLVDGVTKMNLSKKDEVFVATYKKIILGIQSDVRIIIIKLADRLHNMRTLNVRKREKQISVSIETLEMFVPLAKHLGMYDIKCELEDLCLEYMKPDLYKYLVKKIKYLKKINNEKINNLINDINQDLVENKINATVSFHSLNYFTIYKKLTQKTKLSDILDLFTVKILVEDVSTCYQTLGVIHSKYTHVTKRIKDYIGLPKFNKYKSLHTTIFGKENLLYQIQIRTYDMDQVNKKGITKYWMDTGNSASLMQLELIENFDFFQKLILLDLKTYDSIDFLNLLKREVLSKEVYVYNTFGKVFKLPKGSTIIDFAYLNDKEMGSYMQQAFVNNTFVNYNYELKNRDIVKIITNIAADGPSKSWLDMCKTENAKREIKKVLLKNKNNIDKSF